MRLLTRLRGLAAVAAALLAGTALGESAKAEGVYTVEHRNAAGDLLHSERFPNLVVTTGKNDLLDRYLSGSSYTGTFYLGLVDGASAPSYLAGDTMASHPGWAENIGYSNAARPTVTFAAAAGGSKASNAIVFNINAAGTIAGCFLTTASGKSGAAGVLISAGSFVAGNRVLQSGDTLSITYSLSV